MVYPEDLDRVESEITAQTFSSGERHDYVHYHILTKQGEIRYVEQSEYHKMNQADWETRVGYRPSEKRNDGMLYSSAGLLALIIHLIINHDILLNNKPGRESVPAHRPYYAYLLAVFVYYITDILWGVLYEHHLTTAVSIDTTVYFLAMACSILLWTRYVVAYLEEDSFFGNLLETFGWGIFGLQIMLLVINNFRPVLFTFDESGAYHALNARYVILFTQIAMFFLTSVYAMTIAVKRNGTMRFRYRTISFFSLAMTGFIIGQAVFPLLPLYAIGCMLGGCLLHSFVLENEKEEYRDQLELRLQENILKGNYYDLLTGLPGMTYFFDLADKKRKELAKKGGNPAFLFLDLCGLRFYNRKYGFAAGDRLLQSFARVLTSVFGEENCSRFSQDHFVVFTEGQGLEERLSSLFENWKSEEHPAVRAGIYLDNLSADVSTACDYARAARNEIRNSYVSTFRCFDSDMMINAERRQYIISHLDRAIKEKWIQVYYQPIIRAINGRVCDEEALARWIDPELGFLSPAEFIPILEEANLIYRLDLCVLEQVLEKMRHMDDSGLILVPQSINLSRTDFDSCDIVEEIRKRVDNAGLARSLFSIEITESTVGSDLDFIKEQIDRFHALGFPVWMDDFGSGYSSLDVLANIDVDLIKLDMRFMQEFDKGEKSKIILTELMRMISSLGIDTVCEGVERADQVEFLRDIGCTKLQGFYYTKPLSESQIMERYEKGTQIGFEDPAESEYFNTIGGVNLYDANIIANDDADPYRHYFASIPISIFEVRGDSFRVIRSNKPYRDFTKEIYQVADEVFGNRFSPFPEEEETMFLSVLRRCCETGGRTVHEETRTDGLVVHSIIRRISVNPKNGTAAAVVVIIAR